MAPSVWLEQTTSWLTARRYYRLSYKGIEIGQSGWARTTGLLVPNQIVYQLTYTLNMVRRLGIEPSVPEAADLQSAASPLMLPTRILIPVFHRRTSLYYGYSVLPQFKLTGNLYGCPDSHWFRLLTQAAHHIKCFYHIKEYRTLATYWRLLPVDNSFIWYSY